MANGLRQRWSVGGLCWWAGGRSGFWTLQVSERFGFRRVGETRRGEERETVIRRWWGGWCERFFSSSLVYIIGVAGIVGSVGLLVLL